MDESLELIKHDFNLPNHENELSKAGDVIEKLKAKLSKHKTTRNINDKQFVSFYEETIRALDYVGRLSMSVFAIEEEVEAMYTKQHIHAPVLAKTLWLERYEELHHPYTLLKNRCFKILDELDEFYKELYDKNPPNWNI